MLRLRDLPGHVRKLLGYGTSTRLAQIDPEWDAARSEHLRRFPRCAAKSWQCSRRRNVHHVRPIHLYPDLRLVPGNLVTLCEWHHLHIGHGGDWSAWVGSVRELAEAARRKGVTGQEEIARAMRERLYTKSKER